GGRTGWGGPTGLGRFHPTVLLGRVYPQRGLAMAAVTANPRTGRSRPSSTDGGSPTGRPAGGPHGRGGPPGPDRPPPPRGRDPGSSGARGASPVGPPGGRPRLGGRPVELVEPGDQGQDLVEPVGGLGVADAEGRLPQRGDEPVGVDDPQFGEARV